MEGEVIVSRQEIWPSGMRVMVIDNNSRYLLHMEKLLLRCNYSGITCGEIGEAISFVMDNPQSVDLIISDVFLPGDDGLSILKALALEFDFPVIMMSWCGEIGMIMKYIAHGACDFLIKPLRIKEVRNIWQHVFRSQMGYHVNTLYQLNDSSAIAGNVERKRRGISLTSQNIDQTITDIRDLKKPRLHWTAHLHQQFVVAVNTLGIDSASPTRILELMKVEQLTREQVASHLQKYRIQMLKLNSSVPVESVESSVIDANGERNDYFMMFEEANPLDPMPSLNHMATTVVGNYCSNGAGESSSSSRCTTDDMNSCFDELNWLQNKEAFDPPFGTWTRQVMTPERPAHCSEAGSGWALG